MPIARARRYDKLSSRTAFLRFRLVRHPPPFARLSVTGAGTGSAFVVADSANTQRFTILDNGNVGIATTSPSRALSAEGDELVSSAATTTVHIHSTGSSRGGCLQFTSASGAYFHAYATTTGPLILNAGACK